MNVRAEAHHRPRASARRSSTRTNTLYGTDDNFPQLITIDTATGAGTAVGPTGYSVIGLAPTM
jgi:hypothetical protein